MSSLLTLACTAAFYAAHNRYGSITGRAAPPGQPWVKAFNIFNALGSIAFAYNFTGVLMEIQVGDTASFTQQPTVPTRVWCPSVLVDSPGRSDTRLTRRLGCTMGPNSLHAVKPTLAAQEMCMLQVPKHVHGALGPAHKLNRPA